MKTRQHGARAHVGRRAALVLACILAGATGALRAQQPTIDTPYRWIEKGLRFGVSPGYLLTHTGSLDLAPGSTFTGAGRFRIRVSNPLTFEISTTYGHSKRHIVDPFAEGGPAIVDTVGSSWLMAEAAIEFTFTGARTWHGIQPYILVGGGGVFGLSEEASSVADELELQDFVYEMGSAPDFLAAAGFEWLISGSVGLSFEARDHIWRIKVPEGFFLPEVLEIIIESDGAAPNESEWTNNLELSVTFWYYP